MRAAYLLILASCIAAAQQQSIGSIEQKSGNCSLNFAGIQGGVTVSIEKIECPGVTPQALRFLTRQLNERLKHESLEKSDLKKEVEEWKNRYLELTDRLLRRGISNESSRKVEELLKRGEFEQAGKLLDEAIVDEEGDVDRAAADHYERTQVYLLQFQALKALEHVERAFQYRPRNMKYATAYETLLLAQGRLAEAEKVCAQNLEVARSLEITNPDRAALPIILNNIGIVHKNTGHSTEAANEFGEALQIERAKPTKDAQDSLMVGTVLSNLGNLHSLTGDITEALAEFNESVSVFEELDRQYPGAYAGRLADSLNNLAGLLIRVGKFAEARIHATKALQIETSAGINGGRGSPQVLGNLGIIESMTCNFAAAAEIASRVVLIFRDWAAANPEAFEPALAVSLKNLGMSYLDLNDAAKAEAAFAEDLAIYRRLVSADPRQYSWRLGFAIANEARAKMAAGKIGEAEALFREAIIRETALATQDPEEGIGLASTLAYVGAFDTEKGNSANAASEYEQSIAIFKGFQTEAMQMPESVGSTQDFASAATGLASIYLTEGRTADARLLFAGAALKYQWLASVSCSPKYKRSEADALSHFGHICADLGDFAPAISATLGSIDAYRQLRSSDPSFNGEAFSRSMLNAASVLKHAKDDPARVCAIVREAVRGVSEKPPAWDVQCFEP